MKKNKVKSKIVIIAFAMALCSCSIQNNGDTAAKEQLSVSDSVNIEKEDQQASVVENPYLEFKDYPIYSENYQFYYLYSGKIQHEDFSQKLEKLHSDLEKAKVEKMYVFRKGLLDEQGYKSGDNKSEYVYEGEVRDGEPHGVGIVYYEYQPFIVDEKIRLKVYEGYFDKGRFDDFGIHYSLAFKTCNYNQVCAEVYEYHDKEFQKYAEQYYNSITYVGEYNKGKQNGQGVLFAYPKDEHTDYLDGKYTIENVGIQTGKFKNNELIKGKIYLHGFLLYDGELKDGKKHGKGNLYFQNTNYLAFSGTFNKDKVVKGTLYDPEGNVICEGEWKNELCGMIDFSDEYYKYSKISGRDIAEALGEENGSAEDWDLLIELLEDNEEETENQKTEEDSKQYEEMAMYEDAYILLDSSDRYLSQRDLEGMTAESLRLARNEIYARHGRAFQTEDLNAYFSAQPWYDGYISAEDFDDSVLNEYEKANLDLIKSVENDLSQENSINKDIDWNEKYNEILREAAQLYEGVDTQEKYTDTIKKEYNLWDDFLNEVYQYLKAHLPEDTFNTIRDEQRVWIEARDRKAESERDSTEEYKEDAYYYTLGVHTVERIQELLEYLP